LQRADRGTAWLAVAGSHGEGTGFFRGVFGHLFECPSRLLSSRTKLNARGGAGPREGQIHLRLDAGCPSSDVLEQVDLLASGAGLVRHNACDPAFSWLPQAASEADLVRLHHRLFRLVVGFLEGALPRPPALDLRLTPKRAVPSSPSSGFAVFCFQAQSVHRDTGAP